MANRSIAQKVVKMKRRGKSRRYSLKTVNTGGTKQEKSTQAAFMNVGGGPNREEIALYKQRSGNTLFRNMKTGEIITGKMTPDWLAFWETVYPTFKYSKKEMMERGLPDEYGIIKNNPVPRGEALRRAKEILKETDITMHYRHVDNTDLRLCVFFNSQKTRFFLFEMDFIRRTIRKSGIFRHKEIAIQQYKRKSIRWETTEVMLPEE